MPPTSLRALVIATVQCCSTPPGNNIVLMPRKWGTWREKRNENAHRVENANGRRRLPRRRRGWIQGRKMTDGRFSTNSPVLEGKRALVTGGGTGIGRAFTDVLSENG